MSELQHKTTDTWIHNLEILQEELDNSSSDRSCVIVAAAYLDDILRVLLETFMTPPINKNQDNNLFSGYGPLSSFSNRILFSFRLGLISEYEYRALQSIRKIRNHFAHDLSSESMSDYKDKLLSVMPQRRLLLIKEIPITSPAGSSELPLPIVPTIDESSPRDIFKKTVLCLSNLLAARCYLIFQEIRETPDNFTSLVEIDNKIIYEMQQNLDRLERIIELEQEEIDLIKLNISTRNNKGEENTAEIEKLQRELKEAEENIKKDYDQHKTNRGILSLRIFARDKIQKAFDEQLL